MKRAPRVSHRRVVGPRLSTSPMIRKGEAQCRQANPALPEPSLARMGGQHPRERTVRHWGGFCGGFAVMLIPSHPRTRDRGWLSTCSGPAVREGPSAIFSRELRTAIALDGD
jgi:hypothetical protein